MSEKQTYTSIKSVSSSKKRTGNNHNRNKKKRNSGKSRRWIYVALLFLIFGIGIGLIIPMFINDAGKDIIIKIPKNATLETVEDSLEKYFGESFATDVSRLISLEGTDLSKRYGAYKITSSMSAVRAARTLTHGAQTGIKITIMHARTLQELSEKIAAKTDASAQEIYDAITDKDFMDKKGVDRHTVMMLFMEDTYEVYWSATAAQIVDKITSYYPKFWNESRQKKSDALGLSPSQVMIIASITDEESNKSDEKGKIGRLYINRLQKGMKLQADPTVKYAVGDFSIRRITGVHLKTDSPYNTYQVNGLPPGPIRTTSKRTVDTILDSQPSNHIYMCAKEDFSGYHNFASTYDEHLQNARRYQNALDKRGIK